MGGAGEGWEAEKSRTEQHTLGIDGAPVPGSAVQPRSASLTCEIRGQTRSVVLKPHSVDSQGPPVGQGGSLGAHHWSQPQDYFFKKKIYLFYVTEFCLAFAGKEGSLLSKGRERV